MSLKRRLSKLESKVTPSHYVQIVPLNKGESIEDACKRMERDYDGEWPPPAPGQDFAMVSYPRERR